jgi:hypothetical protein
MAGIYRREYKNKLSEAGIEEACRVVKDASDWETTLPEAIDRAQSKRADIRLAALQSFNYILSNKFIGPDLEELGHQIFEALLEPITSPVSKEEHDEALAALCNLALNQYRDMEEDSMDFLDKVMPTIAETPTERNFRFFAIAFASGFTISCNEKCEAVLSRFLELITNKKKRTVKFEPATIAEIIDAIALLLSILPSTVCVGRIGEQIASAIDIAFESRKFEILTAALDALPVIYECIDEAERTANPEEEEVSATAKHFVNRYKNKIVNLPEKLEKKSDQKAIASKVQSILEFFETGEIVETITLNEQEVDLDEARKITIIDAIRKVTRQHFSNMVSQNTGIHDALGFSLKATRIVLRQKKKVKKQTARERIESTKERQLKLAKDRKKKEKQYMGENHY